MVDRVCAARCCSVKPMIPIPACRMMFLKPVCTCAAGDRSTAHAASCEPVAWTGWAALHLLRALTTLCCLAVCLQVVNADYVNTAMERMAKGDVKFRFVIDVLASMHA